MTSLKTAAKETRLFTIYKKIQEILVGNFRSVRTVRIVRRILVTT